MANGAAPKIVSVGTMDGFEYTGELASNGHGVIAGNQPVTVLVTKRTRYAAYGEQPSEYSGHTFDSERRMTFYPANIVFVHHH